MREGPTLMRFSGNTLNSRPTLYNDSLFMVDMQSASSFYNKEIDTDFRWHWRETDYQLQIDDDDNPTIRNDSGSRLISVNFTEELNDHQYLLLSPWVYGMIIKNKQWHIVHIDGLASHGRDKAALDRLVIQEDKKMMIEAACEGHKVPWNVEESGNKGKGQIILLHGPPGTGKTFTVESLSQAWGCALIFLTVSEIGLSEREVKGCLKKWLTLAETWKAFLLIDEADVFMERRGVNDLQRNGLVAAFLREIKYFGGVLFLTTNRIGQIDDAFISRISLPIGYPPLDEASRSKVWAGLFLKLYEDMSKRGTDKLLVRSNSGVEDYVKNDPQVNKLNWNGREARNALVTAMSLARFKAARKGIDTEKDGFDIHKEDFESVVQMSAEFKKHMYSAGGHLNKEERAQDRWDRGDFKDPGGTYKNRRAELNNMRREDVGRM